ncbi:MAG: DUF58 domain-containing protein [Dermabacter sp.]|nr:DUF58 domain-containing protein [Dermabacter sp.]
MRTSLRPTRAAWALALAAAALWAAGVATGLALPLVIAAALGIFLVLGLIGAALTPLRSSVSLRVPEALVSRGQSIELTARVRAPAATGPLTLHMRLPPALGGPLAVPARASMRLAVPALAHGRHPVGPWWCEATDALGLWRVRWTPATRADGGSAAAVLVAPRLHARTLPHPRGRVGITELSAFSRPYVAGDDPRRIHWRSTARTGTLMTREEEGTEAQLLVVALDPDLATWQRPDGSVNEDAEAALDALASLAASALAQGFRVVVAVGPHLHAPATSEELLLALAGGADAEASVSAAQVRSADCFVLAAESATLPGVIERLTHANPLLASPAVSAVLVPWEGAAR